MERFSLLDRNLGWSFSRRVTVIAPGGVRAYEESDWSDALVVVEHGEIELESVHGIRRRMKRGAVLWLAGMPIEAIHNPGSEPALLVAVARRSGH
ncbi:MAG TPA: hypothetical protein VFA00_06305 [Actinomycetota bacterium]|jgi:quercetin dioxygenase-like cupin family protein|nr:hypothetical protein [Actinomycetota bacterium]